MTQTVTNNTPSHSAGSLSQQRRGIIDAYRRVRSLTDQLAAPLEVEDCVIQSDPDVSPTMWHMAHSTWFFATFMLSRFLPDYKPHDPAYAVLFNSYYNAVGEQFPRPRRGLLSRPTLADIRAYRADTDKQIIALLETADNSRLGELVQLAELGLNHEQQHQELILTDIKHVLSCNPLFPVYLDSTDAPAEGMPLEWTPFDAGLRTIGYSGDTFCYDNEMPRHDFYQCEYQLASRVVTNGEYLRFIQNGGYDAPTYWLSDGWTTVRKRQWRCPLYWIDRSGEWFEFTLGGLKKLDPHLPVCHVSYYEADAYARWADARLATEAEWEIAASQRPIEGNFVESSAYHPRPAPHNDGGPSQMYGDAWEWTASPYVAYPGYKPLPGALGEYNGKFMCNQFVLRGGSCATPQSHIRLTYRNFFPPDARWQFTGIRLAR